MLMMYFNHNVLTKMF